MKPLTFFNNERVELVLTPSNFEMKKAIDAAQKLMAIKVNNWILDQLTIEQLKLCIEAFKSEIIKRETQQSVSSEEDPTPWCLCCGAIRREHCDCPPTAEND